MDEMWHEPSHGATAEEVFVPGSCPHACALVLLLVGLKHYRSSHAVQQVEHLQLMLVQAGPSCRCIPPAACALPCQQHSRLAGC